MNFFEHQDKARRKTGHLVMLFALAVIALIGLAQLLVMGVMAWMNGVPLQEWQLALQFFDWKTLLKVAGGIGLIVVLASSYKLLQLSSGGKVVAEAMGGRLININSGDADELKLLNVVQEMAIASGTPVPPVYLIEEAGINAFAAGYKPSDAVIGVTRGCVQQLNRDELQGVVAHEFSHIFNGDMRLNIRLIGVLHGILVIGMIGYFILCSASRTGYRSRSSKNNSALPFLVLGAGLMAIGYAGTFFGNWIKAAVSRQREFLADSSAVQFTRNPAGISGALKKIGGFSAGSEIAHPEAQEISHLFFGQAVKPFLSNMMSTHPPLQERIARIDPSWSGRFESVSHTAVAGTYQEPRTQSEFAGVTSGFAAATAATATATAVKEELLDSIGGTDDKHVDYAQGLLASLPDDVLDAASEPYGARALVYCLLLDNNEDIREKQWQLLKKNANSVVFNFARQLFISFDMVAEHRLPLLELSLPALKQLTADQYEQFRKNVVILMQADARIDLHEWALYRVLLHHLQPAKTTLAELGSIRSLKLVGKACGLLLSAMAEAGAEGGKNCEADLQAAKESFAEATKTLGLQRLQFAPRDEYDLADLSRALQVLCRLQPLQKPRLLKALCVCVTHDGVIKPVEIELVRAIALNLDCPMPPLVLQ